MGLEHIKDWLQYQNFVTALYRFRGVGNDVLAILTATFQLEHLLAAVLLNLLQVLSAIGGIDGILLPATWAFQVHVIAQQRRRHRAGWDDVGLSHIRLEHQDKEHHERNGLKGFPPAITDFFVDGLVFLGNSHRIHRQNHIGRQAIVIR